MLGHRAVLLALITIPVGVCSKSQGLCCNHCPCCVSVSASFELAAHICFGCPGFLPELDLLHLKGQDWTKGLVYAVQVRFCSARCVGGGPRRNHLCAYLSRFLGLWGAQLVHEAG